MSTKRPLHMFQQRSPKRLKALHLQGDVSANSHQKYPGINAESYNPQQAQPPSKLQQSYPPENTNFGLPQNDRNFYHPQGQPGPNYNQLGPGILYQQPVNNLGYNPGQNLQSYNTGYNNGATADHRPQYSGQRSNNDIISSNQDVSKSNVPGMQYGGNSYQDNLNLVNQSTCNNRSFEDKSTLYKINQTTHQQPSNSSIRYYNHQQNAQSPQKNPQFPQQNAQFPQQNAHFPQQNTQLPPQNAQFPQQNTQFPQQNPQIPQQNAHFPHQNAQFSVPNSYPPPGHMVRTQTEYLSDTRPRPRGPGPQYPSHTATSHAPVAQNYALQTNKNPVSQGSYPTTQYKLESTPNVRPSHPPNENKKLESKSSLERNKKVSDSNKPHLGRKRIITCNISAMLHWAKLHYNTEFMFELFACLNSVERKSDVSYKLQLKDSENNVIDANYFLSSTTQPELVPAKYYRVIGKVINASFHCFKLKEVPYMETRNAVSLIKQSEIAMSKLILRINEN